MKVIIPSKMAAMSEEITWKRVTSKSKDRDRRPQYICLLDKLDRRIYKQVMKKHGYDNWRRSNVQTDQVKVGSDREHWRRESSPDIKFVIAEGKYAWSKRLYSVKCKIKSRLSASNLTNKVNLHIMLQETDVIPKTLVYPDDTISSDIFNDTVWVWRPEEGYAGEGVRFIDDHQQFIELQGTRRRAPPRGLNRNNVVFTSDTNLIRDDRREAATSSRRSWPGRSNVSTIGNRALLSQYVSPHLMNGYKFHIRMFYIIVADRKTVSTYLCREGLIGRAAKPFVMGNFSDSDIHDTRLCNGDYRFPRDFPSDKIESGQVLQQMAEILTTVSNIVERSITLYPESEEAYEIFGCDFMVDSRGKVYLIEINFKADFSRKERTERLWLSNLIFESIFHTAIDPVFNRTIVRSDNEYVIKLT